MTKQIFLFLAFVILAAGPHPAAAHAFVDHTEPPVGSTVQGSPATVQIWFSTAIEPAFSTIKVQDAAGQEVDNHDLQRDASNHALLKVSLQTLKPGKYKVIWRAVSVDTHTTNGDFSFTVSP